MCDEVAVPDDVRQWFVVFDRWLRAGPWGDDMLVGELKDALLTEILVSRGLNREPYRGAQHFRHVGRA